MRKPILKSVKSLIVMMLFAALSLIFGPPSGGSASTASPLVTWPQILLEPVTGSLTNPVHITHAGDGSGRMFVVEQEGRIHLFKNGSLLAQPFLDIQARVLFDSEQGLLSLAFPPGYAGKGYFYVYYTNEDSNNVVSRFHLSGNPDQADAASEEVILLLEHPFHGNHNGGQIAFGPDGNLYIATGDGGGGGDPQGNAQDKGALLGKILRIDVEPVTPGPPRGANDLFFPLASGSGEGIRYRIPSDNPFMDTPGARGEIWAWGLRNPWRFSFDRTTGDLYIGDVGQDRYEEIDFQPAASQGGENYGWNVMEGYHCYIGDSCDQTGLVLPVLEYNQGPGNSTGCSVTGGFVYRGPGNPGMQGFYFYGDYCSGRIWAAIRESGAWQSEELLNTDYFISSFGEDQAGNLYLANRADGQIFRIVEIP